MPLLVFHVIRGGCIWLCPDLPLILVCPRRHGFFAGEWMTTFFSFLIKDATLISMTLTLPYLYLCCEALYILCFIKVGDYCH